MKVKEAIAAIEADGWVLVRQAGSHRQYRHPEKPGTVTIVASQTMISILGHEIPSFSGRACRSPEGRMYALRRAH